MVEIVVVDDGSTDETSASVEALSADGVVTARRANGGPAAARNTGAAMASGRWLVFLDSDDELLPGAIRSFQVLAAPDGVGLVSTGLLRRTAKGARLHPPSAASGLGGARVSWNAGAFAVRRDLFEAAGGYDEALRHGENTDLIIRVASLAIGRRLAVVAGEEATVRYEAAPDQARDDSARLESVQHLLARGRLDLMAPSARARMHAIAAVNASRCRRYGASMHHAAAAVRVDPRDPRHIARLAVAATGPLGRLWWSSPRRRRIT